jgi:hypothetical protein
MLLVKCYLLIGNMLLRYLNQVIYLRTMSNNFYRKPTAPIRCELFALVPLTCYHGPYREQGN